VTANAIALCVLLAVLVGSGLCIFVRYRILKSKRERKQHEWLLAKRLLESENRRS